MKKILLTLVFFFQILMSYAQNEELILGNEVIITNRALIDILVKEVYPRVVDYDDGVFVSMYYDETFKTDALFIKIVSMLLSKEEWESLDGFCFIGDVVILFKNCKRSNIILKKENPMSLTVYPDDAKINDDGIEWIYEFRDGKIKLLERLVF